MKLSKVTVENYRCFEHQEILFDEQLTVIIGVNSAGKTTVLDAIASVLSNYLSQFPTKTQTFMKQSDVRMSFSENGSQINEQQHFPLIIGAKGTIFEQAVTWKSQLNGEKTRPTVKDLAALKQTVAMHIRDKMTVMPLVTYYGTGRLHLKPAKPTKLKVNGRFYDYANALESNINLTNLNRWFEKLTYIQLQEGKQLPELQVVLNAISQIYQLSDPDIQNVVVYFDVKQSQLMIEISRHNYVQKLPLTQMSDGVRTTLMMVADIAYRMASINGFLLERVLQETPGIVIIDEIDLHLHPQWQKRILNDLQIVFPMIQWVVTTHAPSILTNIQTSQLRVLKDGVIQQIENQIYGKNIDDITRFVFETDVRPQEVIARFKQLNDAIETQRFDVAKKLLEELETMIDQDERELIEARVNYQFEKEFSNDALD